MATVKAANITNLDSDPKVAVSAKLNRGNPFTIIDTIETPAILSIGDIVILARVPVDATLLSVKVANDDLGTTGDLDLGFYVGTTSGGTAGAVLDADAISADIDMNTAAVAMTEYRYDVLNINTIQQPVWDLATLSERPDYDYIDICLTATEATTAIGTISVIVQYMDAVN